MEKNHDMKICNRNCQNCKKLNIRTDDKGYPYGYECLKYGDSVLEEQFQNTKYFNMSGELHEA